MEPFEEIKHQRAHIIAPNQKEETRVEAKIPNGLFKSGCKIAGASASTYFPRNRFGAVRAGWSAADCQQLLAKPFRRNRRGDLSSETLSFDSMTIALSTAIIISLSVKEINGYSHWLDGMGCRPIIMTL